MNGARRVGGEFLGSAGLAAVVVGSGIAAQRLSPSDTGLQLLENAIATALGLTVLILVFAPISGRSSIPSSPSSTRRSAAGPGERCSRTCPPS